MSSPPTTGVSQSTSRSHHLPGDESDPLRSEGPTLADIFGPGCISRRLRQPRLPPEPRAWHTAAAFWRHERAGERSFRHRLRVPRAAAESSPSRGACFAGKVLAVSRSTERDRWAGDPHRPAIGMLGLDDRPEMTDLLIVEHLVEGVDPSNGDTRRRAWHTPRRQERRRSGRSPRPRVRRCWLRGGRVSQAQVGVKRRFPPDREEFDRAIAHENDRHRAVGGLKRGEQSASSPGPLLTPSPT